MQSKVCNKVLNDVQLQVRKKLLLAPLFFPQSMDPAQVAETLKAVPQNLQMTVVVPKLLVPQQLQFPPLAKPAASLNPFASQATKLKGKPKPLASSLTSLSQKQPVHGSQPSKKDSASRKFFSHFSFHRGTHGQC